MPIGNSLELGHVLLNYVHKLTRILRDLLFIEMPKNNPLNIDVIIGPTHLTPRQIEDRKLKLQIELTPLTNILDYSSLRCDFKSCTTFNFCPCSIDCPWNLKVLQILTHFWECCQVVTMNLSYHTDRRILSLRNFRVPGIIYDS